MYLFISKPFSLLLFIFFSLWWSQQLNAQGVSCSVSIQINNQTPCEGEETTITAKPGSGFTPTTYNLYLNDKPDRSNNTGVFAISQPGDYYVIASDGASCTDAKSNTRTVTFLTPPLRPVFLTNPDLSTTNACSGDEIIFSLRAPQENTDYIWNFGDGTPIVRTRFDQTVTHIFTANGTGTKDFTVSVQAINLTTGCTSRYTEEITIIETPVVSFTEKNNFQICLPKEVQVADTVVTAELTNTTESPYLEDIRTYYVDWGDGKGEQVYTGNPFPLESSPYAELGNYDIKIRVVNKNGCETIFEETFRYSQDPTAGFEFEKKREKEDQMPPCVPVIVTPSDTAKGGDLSYKWEIEPEQGWNFESGNDTTQNPVFKFTESGVYNIRQIVTNECAADTAEQSIIVGWPQVQPPTGGTFCGPTTIPFRGGGLAAGGGGPGSIIIDKNLGEVVSVKVNITGPTSFSRTFPSPESVNFDFEFNTPGSYNMTIEAINECGSSNSIFQGQPPPPIEFVILRQPTTPTVQNPGVVCEGDKVTLTATGQGPVYAWFDSNAPGADTLQVGPSPSFTTPALTGPTATYYVAVINDANGVKCGSPLREVAISVRERIGNNTIEIGGGETQNICKGGTVQGTITGTTPTGGDGSTPNFLWIQSTTGPDGGFTAAAGTNNNPEYKPGTIAATTWFRRVVSIGSCTPDTSNAVQIIAVDPVPASANTIGPAQEICEGDTPGQLIGSAPTGGAGAPYTFLWEISTTGPASGFTNAPGVNNSANYTPQNLRLGETWFRRQVTSGGCTTPSEPVKITLFPKLTNNTIAPLEQEVCSGTAPAALTGSAPTGGKGQYSYQWLRSTTGTRGSFTAVANNGTGQSFTPGSITETTYFRRVVTSAGCGADTSAAAIVRVRPAITGNSIQGAQQICSGKIPSELTGDPVAGGNITYRWESSTTSATAGFGPAPGTNTGASYTPPALTRDTWFRRVAISQGCESPSEAVLVTVLPLPAPPTLTVKDTKACPNGPATLTVAANGGNKYRWYDAPTGGTVLSEEPTLRIPSVSQTTTYYVEAVNNNECVSSTRTAATVTVVEPVADAGPDVTIVQGQTTELRATGGTTYLWEPAEGLNNPNIARPVARPDVTTTYTVTVTTAEGCVATDEVTVTVIPAIKPPNAFTPNRDGVNETWEIENIGEYPDVRVEIFNRWGNIVFTSNGYREPWDGTLKGSDLPVATYYYMIYLNKDMKPISGHVTIIR